MSAASNTIVTIDMYSTAEVSFAISEHWGFFTLAEGVALRFPDPEIFASLVGKMSDAATLHQEHVDNLGRGR